MNIYSKVFKIYTRTMFVVLLVVVFGGSVMWHVLSLAQITPEPIVSSDMQMEIARLMDAGNFAEAERVAREKNLDPRAIAVIMAYAGKKDEAFAMFLEFIHSAPEDIREGIVLQSVNFLTAISPSLGKEFSDKVERQNIISFDEGTILCREVTSLIRSGKLEEAEHKPNLLLDSLYAGEDLITAVVLLISNTQGDSDMGRNVELHEKLLKNFPDNVQVRLQWISALAELEPQMALAELELIRTNYPDSFGRHELFISRVRARAFENMGERERAKAELLTLIGTNYEVFARNTLDRFERAEHFEQRVEQELREKISQAYTEMHKPFEFPEPPPRNWTFIICMNLVFIAIIIYLLWRERRKKNDQT